MAIKFDDINLIFNKTIKKYYGYLGKHEDFDQIKFYLYNDYKSKIFNIVICEKFIGITISFLRNSLSFWIYFKYFFLESLKIFDQKFFHYSVCHKGFFQCEIDLFCISLRFRCDGIYDCYDKTDEENCDNHVIEKFKCDNDSKIISFTLVCDEIYDCQDKTDEINCGT